MKTTQQLVGAQGVSNAKTTIAQIFACTLPIYGVLVLILNFLLFTSEVCSQSYDTLDVALFETAVNSQSGILMEGETATIYFHLGTKTAPVSRAIAFDIDLDLGTNTVLPVNPEFGIGSSWMLTPASTSKEELSDTVAHSIRLIAERTDSVLQNGYGEVFRITLEAAEDSVDIESLVAGSGGTLIVDNIGFKHEPIEVSTENRNPVVYPNPVSSGSNIHFEWNGELPETVFLVNMQGTITRIPVSAWRLSEFDLGEIAPGNYKVVMNYANGREVRSLIVY